MLSLAEGFFLLLIAVFLFGFWMKRLVLGEVVDFDVFIEKEKEISWNLRFI